MIAPVFVRPNYSDLFGESMLPVLEELFRTEYDQHPSRRELLFQVKSTDRDIWQSTELHDMPLHSIVAEGTDYSFQKPKQGAKKTLVIDKFGLGFSISQEAVDDGKFDYIADAIRKMGESARESQEISAMNILNLGFTTETTADGRPLFDTAHTLPSGSTFRNELSVASDLSVSSLETMLAEYETNFVGDSGIIKRIKPKFLVVHPSQKRYAMELIGSDLKADTADNNMNSIKQDGLMVVSSPHLTDADAWFLLSEPSQNGLRIALREGVQTMAAGLDAGFVNDSVLYKSRYREKIAAIHAYGAFGTPGA